MDTFSLADEIVVLYQKWAIMISQIKNCHTEVVETDGFSYSQDLEVCELTEGSSFDDTQMVVTQVTVKINTHILNRDQIE